MKGGEANMTKADWKQWEADRLETARRFCLPRKKRLAARQKHYEKILKIRQALDIVQS